MSLAVTDEATGALVPLLLLRDGARVLNPPPLSSAEREGLASLVAESGRSIRTDDYLGECRRRGVEAGLSAVPMRHWIRVPPPPGPRRGAGLAPRTGERPVAACA